MKYRKILNSEQAVSPIVATLILLVVAIAGAAAVGTILGSFSSDVSDEASTADATSAASTEILVGGSTSVSPLAESLKAGFEESHAGTKIAVQEGGDSVGISALGMDVIDVALLSREMTHEEEEKYPDLKTHWIGSSAVVIIGGEDVITNFVNGNSTLTPHDLHDMYHAATSSGSVAATNLTVTGGANVTVYKRAETRSGPEYTFSSYIGHGDGDFIAGTSAVEVTGDHGMLEAIAKDPTGLGFVDFRFALEAAEEGMDINFIGVTDGACTLSEHCVEDTAHMMKHVEKALNGEKTGDGKEPYPTGLLNNMYMVTNGWPSSVEARFINFAQQPSSMDLYTDAGYFSLLEISGIPSGSDLHGHDH
ncbi:substrate-binding domain-containing protein [Methanolobus sp. ZRKC2]|uniref:substrate-binding domain-containing protein n=1 Tax=Methanolobus sp. ZRKC2 TaxID=3125783 RepID=UPI0032485F6A